MRPLTLTFTLSLSLFLAAGLPAFAQEPAPEAEKQAEKAEKTEKQAEKEGKKGGEAEPGESPKEARKRRKAEKKKEREAKKNGGREIDTESAEARALADALNANARYSKKDGTVHLRYGFAEAEEIADFSRRGFDAADRESGFGKGRRRAGRRARSAAGKKARHRLELSAGSRGGGMLLHKLELEDEFEVTFTLHVMRMTKRSDLVVFVGKGGARFGSQPVQRKGSGFRALSKKAKPLTEPFSKGAVKVTLKAKNGELSVVMDGVTVATTKKLRGKLDGTVGLFARDMLVYVYELEIKGRVNQKKLLGTAKK
jgi:hypothetical protein